MSYKQGSLSCITVTIFVMILGINAPVLGQSGGGVAQSGAVPNQIPFQEQAIQQAYLMLDEIDNENFEQAFSRLNRTSFETLDYQDTENEFIDLLGDLGGSGTDRTYSKMSLVGEDVSNESLVTISFEAIYRVGAVRQEVTLVLEDDDVWRVVNIRVAPAN